MNNQKKVTEADVRKAVRKAFKNMMKEIENEPILVIDSDDEEKIADETITDIRKWLFDREVRP